MSGDRPGTGSWGGAGFALIAVGAVVAFTFTGRILGLDADVAGIFLMAAGAVALLATAIRRRRGPG